MYFSRLLLTCFVFSVSHCASAKTRLIKLDEYNWHEMLEGEWMVEFFAPWCPACRALNPIWEDFASWSDDLGINVAQVDVTASPGLSGRFMVTSLPTIFHVKNGSFRQYRGSREKDEFMTFIEEQKWQNVDEIPFWKSPGSYQMAIVAQIFKLSMVLRNAHTSMVEDLGFPVWASYISFALATILLGVVIGLILVCFLDIMFPPKLAPVPTEILGRKDDEDLPEELSSNGVDDPSRVDGEGEAILPQSHNEDSADSVRKRIVDDSTVSQ